LDRPGHFTGPSTAWRSRGFRTATGFQSERKFGGLNARLKSGLKSQGECRSARPGGRFNLWEIPLSRTGRACMRRFFSQGRKFWAFKRNQKNQKPNRINGRPATTGAGTRIYFQRSPRGRGHRKSGIFDHGPAAKRVFIGAKLAKLIFYRAAQAALRGYSLACLFKKPPRNSGWGGRPMTELHT
jgi:hypothetical protein